MIANCAEHNRARPCAECARRDAELAGDGPFAAAAVRNDRWALVDRKTGEVLEGRFATRAEAEARIDDALARGLADRRRAERFRGPASARPPAMPDPRPGDPALRCPDGSLVFRTREGELVTIPRATLDDWAAGVERDLDLLMRLVAQGWR